MQTKAILATAIGLAIIIPSIYFLTSSQSGSPANSVTAREKTANAPSQLPNTTDNTRYTVYSADTFENTQGRRVLFFYAAWCPFCQEADSEFIQNGSQIPEDVTVFKTDYDTESALKNKYDITYQHTFVLVDENGAEIKKWNGGGLNELIKNLQ